MHLLASSFDTFSNVFVNNSVTDTDALKLDALTLDTDILTFDYFYVDLLLSFTFITFLPSFLPSSFFSIFFFLNYFLHILNIFFFHLCKGGAKP
jgi:hypothetical protein